MKEVAEAFTRTGDAIITLIEEVRRDRKQIPSKSFLFGLYVATLLTVVIGFIASSVERDRHYTTIHRELVRCIDHLANKTSIPAETQ